MTTPTTIRLPDSFDLTKLDWRLTACEVCQQGSFAWGDRYDADDDGDVAYAGHGDDCWVSGSGIVSATLSDGRVLTIAFDWIANGNPATYLGMWEFEVELMRDGPTPYAANFVLVDEDDWHDIRAWDAIIEDTLLMAHWEVDEDLLAALPKPPAPEDVDTAPSKGDPAMQTLTISRDDAPQLRFQGELVAEASSVMEARMGRSTGRWTELNLYRTAGGKLVCEQIGRTQWEKERDFRQAAVAEDEAGVVEFFGHGWLAKQLYSEAGIEDVETVE